MGNRLVGKCSDGAYERTKRCSQEHPECGEAREETGAAEAVLEGYCEVPDRNDEAR